MYLIHLLNVLFGHYIVCSFWSLYCMRSEEPWKCADPELEKQIRCFPYIARSVVERLQATLSMPLNDRGISD